LGIGEGSNKRLENSRLISETDFSQNYSSAWRSLAPATDLFVRKLNMQLCEREFTPMKSMVSAGRRAFINEIAFQLFGLEVSGKGHFWMFSSYTKALNEGHALTAIRLARQTIGRIEGVKETEIEDPNDDENVDIVAQVERLGIFFSNTTKGYPLEVAPKFPGCGIIDTCFGDIRFGDTLYEIKAGERTFRSVDVRQLLVYAALSKSAEMQQLHHLGLFNPRTGISFCMSLDDLCLEISGQPSEELLAAIIRTVSSGDTSR
jgi:hypothetical protein